MYRYLYALVGLSVALDIVLGAWASISWGSFATFWFHDPESVRVAGAQLTGLVLALALLFVAALQGYAFWRIRAEDESGYRILILFSGYLVVSSLITFFYAQSSSALKWGGIEFLVVDGLRGLLLGTFALLAMREPATVRELRLPAAGARTHQVRPSRDAGEQRDRRRRRARGSEGRRQRSSRPAGATSSRASNGAQGAAEPAARNGRRRRRRSPRGRNDGEGFGSGSAGNSAPAA